MRMLPIIIILFFGPIAVFATDHEDYGKQIYEDFEKFEHKYYTVDYPAEWYNNKVIDCYDYVDEQTCNEYIEKAGNDEIKVDDRYASRTDSVFDSSPRDPKSSSFHISKFDETELYEGQDHPNVYSEYSIDHEEIEISGRIAYKIITTDIDSQNSNITEIDISIPVGYSTWSLYARTFDDEFPEHEAVIDQMVDSFQLVDKTPYWVIKVAELWCDGKIGDNVFIPVIKYLSENNIITTNRLHLINHDYERPDMLKQHACEWVSDPAQHVEFMDSMKFYIIDEQLDYN